MHNIFRRRGKEPTANSGVYVDVENLRGEGQALIKQLIDCWPDHAPAPARLALYVWADQSELWKAWAASQFPHLKVVAKGTQRFSNSFTKNSADMAMACDAIADLVFQRVTHVTVFSDDSDFFMVYSAIADEPEIPRYRGKPPFLWVMTDRPGTVSPRAKEFFPPDHLHILSTNAANGSEGLAQEPAAIASNVAELSKAPEGISTPLKELIDLVIKETPVGPFKSTDCLALLKRRLPNHPQASLIPAAFGIWFKNEVWPLLEWMGVRIENPDRKPVSYIMTDTAKNNSIS